MPTLRNPTNRLDALHWPHLALLAAWLPWAALGAGAGWPTSVRLGGWLVLNLAVLAIAERVRPYRTDWRPSRADLCRDGTVLSLNLVADAGASILLALAAVALTPATLGWSMPLQVLSGIALAELGSYAIHRWSHSNPALWRVHLLHHRPERLNVANGLTAHPVNALYDRLARALPLVLLGYAPEAITLVALFDLTQSLATHANVRGTLGGLIRIVGSAELHRLHHSTDAAQSGNFGTAVPLWDQVFGTYRHPGEVAAVGPYEAARYPDQHALVALLRWPFESESKRRFRHDKSPIAS